MPASPPDSTDSPPRSAGPSRPAREGAVQPDGAGSSGGAVTGTPLVWRRNAWLFLATVGSVFVTAYALRLDPDRPVVGAAQFTCAMLGILLAHEFGHYIAARIHGVDASLPYFIPLPILSPFGTMGAVIRMRSSIPTRRALLDIGAAGPLAGLALAIPIYAWGVAHSHLIAISDLDDGGVTFGTSGLTWILDHFFAPPVPEGSDILLSPFVFAGWAGMFVTMINLIPAGQLDGGHVAYALFGPRQNRIAQWVHRSMLVFFVVGVASFVLKDVRVGIGGWHVGRHIFRCLFWFVWFEVLAVLGSLSSGDRRGERTERAEADGGRLSVRTRAFATLGLAVMACLFHDRSSIVLWLAWIAGFALLIAMEVRWGVLGPVTDATDHPQTSPQPLGVGRAIVAAVTLLFFALLFMPIPIAM